MGDKKVLNLYQRLSAITNELTAVAKNLNVGVGKSTYKATGEADVLAAVKPLEEKYGIYSFPISRSIIENDRYETESTYNGQTKIRINRFMRVKTVYRFINIDNTEEFIDMDSYGDGLDSGDKAPGKAITYGDKYALLKAYKIITGEDPDIKHSNDGDTVRKNTTKQTPQTQKATLNTLKELMATAGTNEEVVCKAYNVNTLDELTQDQTDNAVGRFKKK